MIHNTRRWPNQFLSLAALVLGLTTSCSTGNGSTKDESLSIVVTYSILGSVVEDLVGEIAGVSVVIPDRTEPHEYQPSAKDVRALSQADAIVGNGFNFEEGLVDAIASAKKDGVPTFFASDAIEGRKFSEHSHEASLGSMGKSLASHDAADELNGSNEDFDPHLWLDPLSMRDVVEELSEFLESKLDIDLGDRPTNMSKELRALDEDIRTQTAAIPGSQRKLVTDHEVLGYFADRYDFEVVGAITPSTSPEAEPSAKDIANLKEIIKKEAISAIFVGPGGKKGAPRTLKNETGVSLVEISTEKLGNNRTYEKFMERLTKTITENVI